MANREINIVAGAAGGMPATVHAKSLMQTLRKGPLRVAILGSGNWASAVATLICPNSAESYIFHDVVKMWCFDEVQEDGRLLTQWINEDHENVKYLKGIKLPENLIAVPNIVDCAEDADLLIFVMPHQFLIRCCDQLRGHVKPSAQAITLVKGLHVEKGNPSVFSDVIRTELNIECSSLSGANVAKDVARQQFCETTIGFLDQPMGYVWQQLFDRPFFKVGLIPDVKGIQVCGALKNLVALAAGFVDGLNMGTNTKSAIIRLGVEEIKLFSLMFFDGCTEDTYFESAGMADVITTCFGGRNVACAAEFVRRGGLPKNITWEEVERDLLGGQKMQGQLTCAEVQEVLETHNVKDHFPLFTATWGVAFGGEPPIHIIEAFSKPDPRPIKLPSQCTRLMTSESITDIRRLIQPRTPTDLSSLRQ